MTSTTATSGTPPVDTSKMTPEQKAGFEAAMKARQAKGPRTRLIKSCMTKEKLEREPFQEAAKASCTDTVISSTRSLWHAKRVCTQPNSVGEFMIEVLSPERIKESVQMNQSDDKHAMAVQVSISGKWLGSSCGKIK
jgi:Rod binding domain-containing protein